MIAVALAAGGLTADVARRRYALCVERTAYHARAELEYRDIAEWATPRMRCLAPASESPEERAQYEAECLQRDAESRAIFAIIAESHAELKRRYERVCWRFWAPLPPEPPEPVPSP